MKKVFLFLLTVATCACFAGCGGKKSDAGVYYSIDRGTKIEDLSDFSQKEIGECVTDCKVFLIDSYKAKESYSYDVVITDTFVYDFSGVNESALDQDSLKIWNMLIEQRNNKAKPLMYVEFDGYALESDCPIIGLNATAAINGFFVFDDNSVLNLSYNTLVLYTTVKTLIDGTELINCGDKYAGEFTFLEIKTFDKQPIKLHLV